MKTSFPKPAEPLWYVVDAADQPVGRLATRLAVILRGKHKASFVPHLPCGDHVIVINAEKIRFTGSKMEKKKYYHHTGYFGGLKEIPVKKMLEDKPEQIITFAVKGMLPKNAMREHLMKRLHVYTGAEHDHAAQKPEPLPKS